MQSPIPDRAEVAATGRNSTGSKAEVAWTVYGLDRTLSAGVNSSKGTPLHETGGSILAQLAQLAGRIILIQAAEFRFEGQEIAHSR